MIRSVTVTLALVALSWPLGAPARAQDVDVGGQIRPRWEFRDSLQVGHDDFTSMRVRAHVDAALDEYVSVFIQLQDVRLFGEETNTLGDFRADNFDLHQGYVGARYAFQGRDLELSARVGRQEMIFGEQRLIGAVNWAQQGRAFDGVRLTAEVPSARVDLFGMQIADASAVTQGSDAFFVGGYGALPDVGPGALDVYLLFNTVDAALETDQATLGARWAGTTGPYSYRAEASLQLGDRAGRNVTAFMLGARAGRSFAGDAARVVLWYDYLSGDETPTTGTVRVFDTLFATNHPLYGFADFFTNIPRDTRGRGLQDLAVKAGYNLLDNVTLGLDIHTFHLARSGPIDGHLGEEIDLTATYGLGDYVRLVGGFSWLVAGDGFAAIGRLTEDATWGYAMLDVSF